MSLWSLNDSDSISHFSSKTLKPLPIPSIIFPNDKSSLKIIFCIIYYYAVFINIYWDIKILCDEIFLSFSDGAIFNFKIRKLKMIHSMYFEFYEAFFEWSIMANHLLFWKLSLFSIFRIFFQDIHTGLFSTCHDVLMSCV